MEVFDYIIIGAGTAGCVLAARLSEDAHTQVLLIEAGPPDRGAALKTPLAFPRLFQSPMDWNFWTEPQPHLANRHLYWPRGRVLGGSGSINAMVHMDACAADFDSWQVPGWSSVDMLPLRHTVMNAGVHAEPPAQLNPLTEAFLESCEATGFPRHSALLDASERVAAPFQVNIKHGRRWTTADAYLRPALRRGNLTVWTNVHVRRILCEGARATGVEYTQSSGIQTVAMTREVILCAGAVNSPHLLLLSGIGPKAQLEALNLPVHADLSGVGHNLQDHLAAPIAYFCLEPVSLSGASTLSHRWKHRLLGTGPLASNGAEAGAVLKSETKLDACDLEILFSAGHYVDHGFAAPGGHGFSLIPVLLAPSSRGSLLLRTADPLDPPVIDPAYLSDAADIRVLSEGIRTARQILEQPSLTRFRGAPVPGRVLDPEEHIREWGQTLYHPAGSCKLGTGPDAVVDPNLKVHGVEGLRIADASIFPNVPRAHTNAPTILVAERAAQLLRG